MLPENWQTVHRLLVLCFVDEQTMGQSLFTALQVLRESLPDAEIRLMALEGKHYTLVKLGSQLELSVHASISTPYGDCIHLVNVIRSFSFDTAIVFTLPSQSPFSLAYLCYLAEIPIRIGQSREFGGGVLSHCVTPPLEAVPPEAYNLHLLKAIELPNPEAKSFAVV